MEARTPDLHSKSPNNPTPSEEYLCLQPSCEEKCSEVKDKAKDEKWSESKKEKENSPEKEQKGADILTRLSGSESSCDEQSPKKWRNNSWNCTPKATGTSPAEGHNEHSSNTRKRKTPDGGHESHKYPRSGPCTRKRRLTGHRQRSQTLRPAASHPPPLRKSLLSLLRFMSEDTCEMLTQLPQEAQGTLAQLRAPLWTLMHSCYAMASQAAYAIPAEGWLLPVACSAEPTEDGKIVTGRSVSPPVKDP